MHYSTQKQLSDVLTKAVKTDQFLHLRDTIGAISSDLLNPELRDGVEGKFNIFSILPTWHYCLSI